MSLLEVIRKVKRIGDVPLIPDIDRFYMSYSAHFRPEDLYREPGFHPSQICNGVCPRQHQLKHLRPELCVKEREEIDPALRRIFGHGHAVHYWYQNHIFGPMGILYGVWRHKHTPSIHFGFQPNIDWEYVEPTIRDEQYDIVGHVDGLLVRDGVICIVDVKTMNPMQFQYLSAPLPKHVLQLQFYLNSTIQLDYDEEEDIDPDNVDSGVLLYVDKSDGQEKEFWVKRDPEAVRPIYQQIDTIKQGIVKRSLSMRLDECKTRRSKRAKKCEACSLCFDVKGFGVEGWEEAKFFDVEGGQ